LDVLKHHNQLLTLLRDRIEAIANLLPTRAPIIPRVFNISEDSKHLSEPASSGPDAALRVQVVKKWQTAEGITGFKLVSIEGPLPTYQPGAHIDVHMPNGLIRQYSLTNGPGEADHYTIGVKLEMESQGGSKCMHEQVREGDVLAISEPCNSFPLRQDAIKTIFVAGGIGITPLLAMSRALHHSRLNYELHYFVQSKAHMAFPDVLESQKDTLVTYLGLTPDQTGNQLSVILKEYKLAQHLYICGPGPMLEATRKIASDLGWPEAAIHFEYFKNTNEIDDSSSFKIDLARSAMTLQVPAGKSILDVLRENSIDMPSSCQQGACGTCRLNVLEGEPDHQDVFLNESEKQNGKSIMTCVSRAKSKRLVLDI
jgi:ferredoxin-NADP reductase